MNKEKIGFGSSTNRSSIAGLHPALTKSGNSGLAPGKYDSDICRCPYKRNMPAGEQWTRKLEMEEYSRYRNYKNIQMLLFKEYQQTLAGPGSHNIPDVTRQLFSSVYENTGFTTVERFKSFKDEKLPPGTHSGKFMKGIGRKSLTAVATLEWDGFQKRKIYDEMNFKLAPNRYKYVDPNDTAQIVNKIVSLKGRYNLFTGPRDNSTIKNYFSQGLTKVPDSVYKFENCMDYLINNPVKKRCGKFLKAPRFPKIPCSRLLLNDLSMCYKNPDDPGPANYDLISVKGIKKSTPNKYAFNDSKFASRKPLDWAICPGPGRYFVKHARCHKKKHHNWVFLTKYPRCLAVKDADPYSIRVRIV